MIIKTNKVWRNTIKKFGGRIPYYAIPKSLEDISTLICRAESENKRVKAVGSGHSFSDVAVPQVYLVDLKRLNQELPLDKSQIKSGHQNDHLVHVEGGMTVQRFNKRMDKKGLCVTNMGGIDNQTLAGAISTGTHGTGIDLPSFPGMVRSLVLVTSGGQKLRIEPTQGITDPTNHNEPGIELIQNDKKFYSTIVSLGCFGIIYSFILELEPMYYLEESKECYQWSEVKPRLLDRSLFFESDGTTPIRGVMFQVNPYKNDKGDHTCIVVRHRLLNTRPHRSIGDATRNLLSSILGSLPMSYWVVRFIANRKPHKLPGMLDRSLVSIQDKRYENKGYKVLYQGIEYVKIRAYDSEFAFDLTGGNNDFIQALEEMFEKAEENKAKGLYQSAPMGIRFVDKSPAYLSPEYNRQVAYIDTPFILHSPKLDEILHGYQHIMTNHNGIPHWGKINSILDGRSELIEKNYPCLEDWQEVFREFNLNKTFSNAFSDRLNLGFINTTDTKPMSV
ncbi:MAG: FAD-binding protein [Bacteroidota bacterium]